MLKIRTKFTCTKDTHRHTETDQVSTLEMTTPGQGPAIRISKQSLIDEYIDNQRTTQMNQMRTSLSKCSEKSSDKSSDSDSGDIFKSLALQIFESANLEIFEF